MDANNFRRLAGGPLAFDPASGELRFGSSVIRLESRAACVLEALSESPGALISRSELLDRCWAPGEGSDEALTQAIAQIRRGLKASGHDNLLETLPKRGYRLRVASGGAGAAVTGRPAGLDRRWRTAAIGAIAATALVVLFTVPHGPRHALRHAFGLGAPASHPVQ